MTANVIGLILSENSLSEREPGLQSISGRANVLITLRRTTRSRIYTLQALLKMQEMVAAPHCAAWWGPHRRNNSPLVHTGDAATAKAAQWSANLNFCRRLACAAARSRA